MTSVKSPVAAIVLGLLVLGAFAGTSVPRAAAKTTEPAPPTTPAVDPDGGAGDVNPACISWVKRAVYRNVGYDHEVEIKNACDRAAACVVTTDVNPEPIAARVDAGATVTVLTFRGSPSYTFTPKVVCRLAKE
jgi:hypothetical protein